MADGELIHDPLPTTPHREPGSARRTSHMDMIFEGERLLLRGGARDVRTSADGSARILGEARLEADLDAAKTITRLVVEPSAPTTDRLQGIPATKGFRAATAAALPAERDKATPLFLLLDELPVATLISGYALLYSGEITQRDPAQAVRADICAGWRSDGTMMVAIGRGEGVPLSVGPLATALERPGDRWSWHELEPLPRQSMRRRRLIDLIPGPEPRFWAMFRDTHVDDAGTETVLHEYVVEGAVDLSERRLTSCTATPRVLPWVECPEAAMSADRLAGEAISSIRDRVRTDLNGTSTCTHLNDLLRSLGDLDALLTSLDEAPDSRPS